MAPVANKRPSDHASKVEQRPAGDSWAENIAQMSDLGNGYMLVKLNTNAPGTGEGIDGPRVCAGVGAGAGIPPGIKQFTRRQLHKLLEKFSGQLVDPPTVGVARTSSSALKSGPAPSQNNQFMNDLRAQEEANRKRDFENGLLLTSTSLADRLQLTTQALGKAVQSQRMFTLDGPSGRKVYPAFFADPRCNREHIERVCQALGAWPGPSKWEFFTSPRVSLNSVTPIEALARGELDQVLRAAAAFKER